MSRRHVAALAAATLLFVSACSTEGSDSSPTTDGPTTTADGGSTTTGGDETTTTQDEPSGDADQVLIDSVDSTLDAESFSVESEANLQIGGQELQLRTDGSIDYADLIADSTIGITGDGQDYEIGILSDGENLWVKAEGDNAPFTVPDGKTWIEGTSDRLADSNSFRPVDLIGVVLALRGSDGAEAGDTKEVDGVEATEYTTTIDYEDAVTAAGDDAEDFKSALSLTSEQDLALDITVWVGDDGVIRQFDLEVDSENPALGGDYTITLSDVGQELDAPEAPPADDTLTGAPAEKLLDQLFTS